jgi:hypothetical protein
LNQHHVNITIGTDKSHRTARRELLHAEFSAEFLDFFIGKLICALTTMTNLSAILTVRAFGAAAKSALVSD